VITSACAVIGAAALAVSNTLTMTCFMIGHPLGFSGPLRKSYRYDNAIL
jgi:hypothetical protein